MSQLLIQQYLNGLSDLEKKPKDPTIREKFNTYRFADHREKVIDLLLRVNTVSVRTVDITKAMEKPSR